MDEYLLKQHVKTVFAEQQNRGKRKKESKTQCAQCGQRFASSIGWLVHVNKKKQCSAPTLLTCENCGAMFHSYKDYVAHSGLDRPIQEQTDYLCRRKLAVTDAVPSSQNILREYDAAMVKLVIRAFDALQQREQAAITSDTCEDHSLIPGFSLVILQKRVPARLRQNADVNLDVPDTGMILVSRMASKQTVEELLPTLPTWYTDRVPDQHPNRQKWLIEAFTKSAPTQMDPTHRNVLFAKCQVTLHGHLNGQCKYILFPYTYRYHLVSTANAVTPTGHLAQIQRLYVPRLIVQAGWSSRYVQVDNVQLLRLTPEIGWPTLGALYVITCTDLTDNKILHATYWASLTLHGTPAIVPPVRSEHYWMSFLTFQPQPIKRLQTYLAGPPGSEMVKLPIQAGQKRTLEQYCTSKTLCAMLPLILSFRHTLPVLAHCASQPSPRKRQKL